MGGGAEGGNEELGAHVAQPCNVPSAWTDGVHS